MPERAWPGFIPDSLSEVSRSAQVLCVPLLYSPLFVTVAKMSLTGLDLTK